MGPKVCIIDTLIQHAISDGAGVGGGLREGAGEGGNDAMRVYSFLFDLVDQHLLPR